MAIMKQVGLNVAADALIHGRTKVFQGGVVIVIGDDPDSWMTLQEIDCRYLARLAEVPMLEPATSQDCKDFTIAAFELSEKLRTPVIVRLVIRPAYAREPVVLGKIQHDVREREASRPARANRRVASLARIRTRNTAQVFSRRSI